MPERPCLVQLCLLILLSAILGASPCGADDRPNIVFILIDDLGWTDLGFMGSDFYQTPNIDRLASQGMTFTNAYMCAASHRTAVRPACSDRSILANIRR